MCVCVCVCMCVGLFQAMIDEPLKKWKKEEFPETASQFITVVLASTSKCYQLCNRRVHRVTSLVGCDYTE